jgi:voltage-gated potassium channel
MELALEEDLGASAKRRKVTLQRAMTRTALDEYGVVKKWWRKHMPETVQKLFPALMSLFLMIILGMLLAWQNDKDLTRAEAFYFAVITSTTIGYGDISPISSSTTKVVGALYLLVTVTCTGNVLGSIAGYFIDKKRKEAMDK